MSGTTQRAHTTELPFADALLRTNADGSPVIRAENAIGELRAMFPLPDDAQRQVDDRVVDVGFDRLTLVADLIAEGLTFSLPNWLAVPELYWERSSRAGYAKRTMTPDTRDENQRIDRSGRTLPIYATIDGFEFGIRELLAAQRSGYQIDLAHVEGATRNCNEAIEDAAWNGAGVTFKGNSTPGVLTAPNVNTQAYKDNEAWTAAGHSGEDIVEDVLAMAAKLEAARRFGPYNLYIPTAYGNKLNQDFKANGDSSIRRRLEDLEFGGRNLRVRVADQLPANRTALIQMTRDVIDVVVGQTPTAVSWTDGPGWRRHFAVLACVVPRVRDDAEGKSGIVIGNTT